MAYTKDALTLKATLKPFYKEDATVDAVAAMYNAIDATTAVLSGDSSDLSRVAVGQMLFDMSTGLVSNPFMQAYGARITPVFQIAVNAYLDHLNYFDEDQRTFQGLDTDKLADLRSRILTCSYVKHEIALAALLCEQGGAALRANSRKLRDALIDMEKT